MRREETKSKAVEQLRARMETDLTEQEVERLHDVLASGPLTRKPIDERLLALNWIHEYDPGQNTGAVDSWYETRFELAEYQARRRPSRRRREEVDA